MEKENPITIKGVHTFTTRDAKTGKILRQETVENLVTTAGRTVLARLLSGDNTYTGEVTHGALGTSSTPVTNGDTLLGAESAGSRVATTSQTYVANQAFLSFFFPAGPVVAYEEFGNFIDGTSTINTGQLFTHVLISGSKAATESLTIDTTYTIS